MFYSDTTNGDEYILQNKTYVALTILKLKFTNLGYFLRLSDFFMAQNYNSNIETKCLIFLRWDLLISKIILYRMLLRKFWTSAKNLFFERRFKFIFCKELQNHLSNI